MRKSNQSPTMHTFLSLSLLERGNIKTRLTNTCNSVEHPDIDVVAINDPFIDPKYAVSATCGSSRRLKRI